MATVKQMEKEAQKKFEALAQTIPTEIVSQIKVRALEAVKSGERHKMTGGWIISPLKAGYDLRGLLHVASTELRKAQWEQWES